MCTCVGEVEGVAVGWFELWCLAVVGAYVGWGVVGAIDGVAVGVSD